MRGLEARFDSWIWHIYKSPHGLDWSVNFSLFPSVARQFDITMCFWIFVTPGKKRLRAKLIRHRIARELYRKLSVTTEHTSTDIESQHQSLIPGQEPDTPISSASTEGSNSHCSADPFQDNFFHDDQGSESREDEQMDAGTIEDTLEQQENEGVHHRFLPLLA